MPSSRPATMCCASRSRQASKRPPIKAYPHRTISSSTRDAIYARCLTLINQRYELSVWFLRSRLVPGRAPGREDSLCLLWLAYLSPCNQWTLLDNKNLHGFCSLAFATPIIVTRNVQAARSWALGGMSPSLMVSHQPHSITYPSVQKCSSEK
jgi:hypothetical protein